MQHNATACGDLETTGRLSGYRAIIKDAITLITCVGTWERYDGNYSHRIIVRAERVPEADAGLLAAPDGV